MVCVVFVEEVVVGEFVVGQAWPVVVVGVHQWCTVWLVVDECCGEVQWVQF